jgi:uncharacterized protein (DUF849 family)
MSPHLPITPRQIADEAVAAAEAGAAMLHLHARDPITGAPDQTPQRFMEFLPQIKERTRAIVNITTGGGLGMTLDQRLAPALTVKPEIASMNMGSFNFNISGAADKIQNFKHDWERPYLEATKNGIFANTFTQIEQGMRSMGANGTRFEFECYDIAHLYNLRHFLDRGLVKPPLFIQSVFGILGGIGTHPEDLMHMKRTADRLFEDSYQWSILGAGRNQIALATIGASMGANVRVGLEDSLWAGPGKLAKSNADQVRIIRQVLEGLSLEVATPDEAREILQLKGGDQVAF